MQWTLLGFVVTLAILCVMESVAKTEKGGYTFAPISEIILKGEYTIDHTGKQCPAG